MKTFYSINELNFNPEQKIYQYVPLKYFIKLLKTGFFHINPKSFFEDFNENQLPLKSMLPIFPVGKNVSKISPEQIKSNLNIMNAKMYEYRQSPYKLASCWTHSKIENILMWKSYAFPYGVRIETTIDKFITSLDSSNFDILVGKIKYGKYHFHKDILEILFTKEKFYQDEREIRFYFIPTNIEMYNAINTGIDLRINLDNLIDNVILSPFHSLEFNQFIKSSLQSTSSLKIQYSNIKIKH